MPVPMAGDDVERPSLRRDARRVVHRLPLQPTSDLPSPYILIQILIQRLPGARDGAMQRVMNPGSGPVGRWETTGEQISQRWCCHAPSLCEGSDP
jgi:hypothetical protein